MYILFVDDWQISSVPLHWFHMLVMILRVGYFGEKKQNKTNKQTKQNKTNKQTKKPHCIAEVMPLFPERESAHVNNSSQ